MNKFVTTLIEYITNRNTSNRNRNGHNVVAGSNEQHYFRDPVTQRLKHPDDQRSHELAYAYVRRSHGSTIY